MFFSICTKAVLLFCAAQTWTDYRLTWNASDFGDLTHTLVDTSKIWTPELLLSNK